MACRSHLAISLVEAGDIYRANGGWERRPIQDLHVPRSVRDAVQRRLEPLSTATRHVLQLAAVAGRRFDFALLQELTAMDEHELLQRLKQGIKAQLIVEETADQFKFRHALTQEAVYASLLIRERKRLHRLVAETLERLYADALEAHAADLAYHFYQAQAWDKVLEYAQRAGEKAQAMYAPRIAAEQFTHALEAADQLALTPPAALYRARGLAYETLGDFDRAWADLRTGLESARARGDRQAEWLALIDLGFLWASRNYAKTGDYFQQALALARTMGDAVTLAHSLNRLGNWHINVEQPVEAREHHQEALAIFQELNDERGLAQTLDLLGMTSFMGSDLVQSAAFYQGAIALFDKLGDRQGLVGSVTNLPLCAGGRQTSATIPAPLDLAEAVRQAELGLKIAREIGWRAAEAYGLFVLSFTLGPHGEYAGALSYGKMGLEIAEEIEHHQWMAGANCALGALYLDLLALPQALQYLEAGLALGKALGSQHWMRNATGFLALVCIAQTGDHEGRPYTNELDRAQALLDTVLGPDTPAQSLGQRICWSARTELALARGDADLALQIADELIASAANMSSGTVIPYLWRLRGEALARLGQVAEAEATLEAARDAALSQGLRPELWRVHVTLGKLYQSLRAQRRSDDAETEFSAARAVVEDLAANIPDKALRDNFIQHANVLIPPSSPLTPRRAAKMAFGGLTGREREVAERIGQGESNREIAEALVLSERTIETHVSHILNKLGFDSRAQIRKWAIERGLAGRQASEHVVSES